MPIYEYQCDDCEHKLEALQKMSDEPLKDCPECGKASLRKLISAVAFRLKGSGWYETDFKDKKEQKNLSQSDNKPADTSGSKEATKSTKKKPASEKSKKTDKPAAKVAKPAATSSD